MNSPNQTKNIILPGVYILFSGLSKPKKKSLFSPGLKTIVKSYKNKPKKTIWIWYVTGSCFWRVVFDVFLLLLLSVVRLVSAFVCLTFISKAKTLKDTWQIAMNIHMCGHKHEYRCMLIHIRMCIEIYTYV